MRATLKCDLIAIKDEADVQDCSENGYERAGLQKPIDIRRGSSCNCGQFVIQNMYTEVVSRDDDNVEAALGL